MGEENLADTEDVVPRNTIANVPPPVRVEADVAGLSHQGKVRTNNEDVYLVVRLQRALETLWTNLMPGLIPARTDDIGYGMVVADGMGGVDGGEVASSLAVSTLVQLVLNTPDWIMRIGQEEANMILGRIEERYQQVDAVVTEEAAQNPQCAGMGTTMTLACSVGLDLFLGHVGDSRLYYERGGTLRRLTRDHTTAQALADYGLLDPREVATHRLRHVLTQVVGGQGGHVHADVRRLHLMDGDQVLLCTDGLTNEVDDDRISALLREAKSAYDACQSLVHAALENGGRDNVTAVVARYRCVT